MLPMSKFTISYQSSFIHSIVSSKRFLLAGWASYLIVRHGRKIQSRKSTQKRQQQFFEQRKRQQQQQEATNVESHNDSPASYAQQKGNRSLDILSLLNVPKVAEESRPSCVSESKSMMVNRAPLAKAFEVVEIKNHQSSMRSSIAVTNEVDAADYVKPTATRTSSSHQGEKASSKELLLELMKKVMASKTLPISHAEALQNAVRLHKASTDITLEEMSTLAYNNPRSTEEVYVNNGFIFLIFIIHHVHTFILQPCQSAI